MKKLLVLELLIVLAARKSITYLGDMQFLAVIMPPMPVLGHAYLQFAVVLALIAWLKKRGASLSDYGFRDFGPFGLFALVTIAAIATSVVLPTVLDPLLSSHFGRTPRDLSRFATLVGNLPQYLYVMPLVWIFAAFGEEFLYRGFVLENVRRLLGGGNAAMVAAIIVQAALFGAGHAYQGPIGMIPIALGGIVYGLLYWVARRRLWPLILAHGIVDTIGITVIFQGGTP